MSIDAKVVTLLFTYIIVCLKSKMKEICYICDRYKDKHVASYINISLITTQKSIETRLSGIEKKLNDDNKKNNMMDLDYIKVIKMNII